MTQNPFPPSQQTGAPGLQPGAPYRPPRRDTPGGVFKYLVIGCLGIVLLLGVLLAVGSFVAYKKARTWGADLASNATRQMINQTQLPPDQKQRIIAQVDRVSQRFKDKQLTLEQLGQIAERIGNTPVVSMGMVYFFEHKYLASSSLSQEEKEDARRTLERLARGVYEGSISDQDMNTLTDTIMVTNMSGEKKLPEQLTDEELREFLTRAKAQVETAGIPDEPFEVDMASEIEQVVDQFLAEIDGTALPETTPIQNAPLDSTPPATTSP